MPGLMPDIHADGKPYGYLWMPWILPDHEPWSIDDAGSRAVASE